MKTFLSIGTGPGIGLETARRFGEAGFKVILSARTAAKTQALAAELAAQGISAEAITVDASNPSAVAALVQQVAKKHGSLDVVHYNAAAIRKATVEEQALDTFANDQAVNIAGALGAIQAAAPVMASAGGSILLTGGGFAVHPHPDYLSLSIGKAGIRAMALGLFPSFSEKGIHVATVTVACFVTPGSKEAKAIGEKFWTLHNEPKTAWTAEVTYSG